MAFDVKKLSTTDWLVAGGGAVAFIAGFLPWWGVSIDIDDRLGINIDGTVSGWSAGFTAWAGVLLLFLAAVYLVLRRAEVSLPDLPVTPAVAVAGLALIGLLLVLIRLVTLPDSTFGDVGPRFGIWLALLAGIVELVGAVMQFRTSGEKLPWDKAGGAS